MGLNSNVLCKHIHETGCPFYEAGMLCPDNCPGFESIEVLVEKPIVEEKVFDKRTK